MEELWNNSYNRICADCSQMNPQKINMDLEIMICSECATTHEKCSYTVIDVSSKGNITHDFSNFTGNLKSNQYYENNIPAFIHKPSNVFPHILKEHWILAKYERKEFAPDTFSQNCYHNFDVKVGWLWKKEKSGHLFRKRYFVLDRVRETFGYYLQECDLHPKLKIDIDIVSVYLNPKDIEELYSMQIVLKKDGNRRFIFTYAETSEDIYNWYMAIRSVKFSIFKRLNPDTEKDILYKMISHGYFQQGWLYKTGRRSSDRVLRRWFCLDTGSLVYSAQPLDPHPLGEISLICEGIQVTYVSNEDEISIAIDTFCFSLKTPGRKYYFAATNKNEQKDWIENIRLVMAYSKETILQKF